MRRWLVRLSPLVVLSVIFVAVMHVRPVAPFRGSLPSEPYRPDRCTWHCHNHACSHRAILPGWLTADDGAYGFTIRALGSFGAHLSRDRAVGYGLANLLLYCVAWPVSTYALWLVVLEQGRELQRRRTTREDRR